MLVANAGFGVLDRIADARLEDLREMVDVNLLGTARCIKALLPTCSSDAAASGDHGLARRADRYPEMGFYSATKFALVGLARTLMLELYGTGVRCALICPGVAPTGFQQRADHLQVRAYHTAGACTSEQVAEATVRAIERRTHGEVVVPGKGAHSGYSGQCPSQG